jgi:hypothetical protein
MKELVFAQSSRRHRIGRARARYVIEHGYHFVVPAAGDRDEQLTWVGEDDRGLELEVIAIEKPDCILVIHVMPLALRRRK